MPDTHILDKFIDISQDKERKEFSPQEMAASLLSLLKPREAQILRLRYGLDGSEPQTLSQIGEKLDLTRERVRQLEKQSLINISKHNKYNEIITPLRHLVQKILESYGGLMMTRSVILELSSLSKNYESANAAIGFLLSHCLDDIEKVENDNFHPSLKLISASIDFVKQVLDELGKIFRQDSSHSADKVNKILELPEIIKKFEASEYYQNNKDKFFSADVNIDRIIFSYLGASKKFIQTPLGQWGLSVWPEMTPKRINGKIYLALLSVKKPLHFSKITQIINEKWSAKRPIKAATVHNELIADKRFVLVGRGIYALKEWGYESRRVKDILNKKVIK